MKFDVVGLNHHVLPAGIRKLDRLVNEKPLVCALEREPGNLYDPNAIKVNVIDQRWYPKLKAKPCFHIGYIRKSTAQVLAHGFDSGNLRVLRCRLFEVNVDHRWARVRVVFVKKPASKPISS